MKVKTITKYIYNKQEYNTLKDIQDKLHNTIGEEVLDKINRKCDIRHKDLFVMLEIICSPEVRKVLLDTLNVTIDIEDEGEEQTINVLDLK
jgi:hypothetical protein